MESQRIAGRYQVLRAIGRGGMGVVWLCRDEVLGREVAVKQIGGLPGEPEVETARAMREARSAAALNHPNAVSVYDVVDHEGRPFLVMEYVEGRTLDQVVTAEGPLPSHRVADIGAQLAGALAAAHDRGIVHRDVKPGNVLIDGAGRPKISDFGIARGVGDEKLTQTGLVSGTPAFLSPELARGGDPDPASDVWALGATLFVAVEGQAPYESRPNALALLSDIATQPPRPMTRAAAPLAAVVLSMMDQDPAARPDMRTLGRRLARIAVSDPDEADPRAVATTAVAPTAAAAAAGAAGGAPDGESSPATRVLRAGGPQEPPRAALDPVGRDRGEPDRRRNRVLVPLVAAVVLLAALGAVYALTRPAGDSATARSPRVSTSTTSPPKTTPKATKTSARSSTSTTSATSASSSSTSSPPAAAGTDAALAAMVRSYFADVTRDRDVTWTQLTPKMQSAAGGRSGYEAFWSTIRSVSVDALQADAKKGRADVTLTYTRVDGTTSTERHRLDVVRRGGAYLIDADRRLP